MQRLELGRERDPPWGGDHIEGLDPEPVAPEQECLAGRIPDGKGEHPAEGCDAVRTPLLVEVQHGLGVAGCAERMPAGDETGAQLLVVVDLPVEDDHLGTVFVVDRLPTAAQVDDAEASHPETSGPSHVQPLVVRPTMLERAAHAAHQRLRHRALPVPVHDACDAAHVGWLRSKSDATGWVWEGCGLDATGSEGLRTTLYGTAPALL